MTRPPHQHTAATTPVLRGPERSAQPPNSAEADPRNTKNRMNIHCNSGIFQSQVVLTLRDRKSSIQYTASRSQAGLVAGAGHCTDLVIPIACDSGNQNTEKPYAMPMHR